MRNNEHNVQHSTALSGAPDSIITAVPISANKTTNVPLHLFNEVVFFVWLVVFFVVDVSVLVTW